MSFLARVTERAFRAAGAIESKRAYGAAKQGRLVGDWTTHNLSANQEVKASIKQLRARGRQLARDNDYFIGFLKKLVANVIGTEGIKLQADIRKADGEAKLDLNRKVEDAWKDWSRKKNCDVTAQLTFRDIAALALTTLATEGEFMLRYVYDPSSEYGLKLQMLDVDWLDEDYNDPHLPNGGRIVMSVELDRYDRPVAYYFTIPKWATVSIPEPKVIPQSKSRLRVPAEQVCHRFIKDRIGQQRGITWAHGAMLSMNMLDGFDEAELVAARINASNMAFVSPPAETESSLGTPQESVDMEVSPGQVVQIGAGYTVHEFTPNKPQDGAFAKRILRKIATSLGVNYNTLTSDLEGVNFSSIRAGTVEERGNWKLMQRWLADHLYQDIFEKWLMFNSHIIPATALKQAMFPIWRGRGFEWVDPAKDINADIAAVNRGFKTMREIIEERGGDFEDTMNQHATEKKFIEKLGLQFASPDLQAQLAAAKDEEAEDDEKEEKPKKKEARNLDWVKDAEVVDLTEEEPADAEETN